MAEIYDDLRRCDSSDASFADMGSDGSDVGVPGSAGSGTGSARSVTGSMGSMGSVASVASIDEVIKNRQAALDELMRAIEGVDGPTHYSFSTLVTYLMSGPTAPLSGGHRGTLRDVARLILKVADGPVFLADGRVFVQGVLHAEFPELSLFRIRLGDAFSESKVHPHIWVETPRFADLRSLSQMRRELKKTGLVANGQTATDIVKVLLGLA
jgi:hypothetical protein